MGGRWHLRWRGIVRWLCYRTESGIVAFSHAPNRLGLVRDKGRYFLAEFLSKHVSPQFSLPIWDAVRDSVICGSADEAKALTDEFINEPTG